MPTLTSVVEVIVGGVISTAQGRSQIVEQIYHYTFDVPYSAGLPALDDIADEVTTTVGAGMLTLIQSDYVWSETKARWLDDVTVPYANGADTLGSSTITSARLPTDVTVRFEMVSATRGRSYKGGKSFRPIPETQVDGDELTSGGYTSWNSFGTQLSLPRTVTSQVMTPCVVSRVLSQLRTNPTTIIGAKITQAVLNRTLGTMKGRGRRSLR